MNQYRQKLLKEIGIKMSENEIGIMLWHEISENGILSEEFIREFKLNLTWTSICRYQKLSEDFIREFERNLNWHHISKHQQLTDNFIIEFKDEINWTTYFRNQRANFTIINKFILKSDIENLNDFKSSHLTSEQKQTIDKKLILKYMFKK